MADDAKRDNNGIPSLIAVSNADGTTPVTLYADPTTHRLLVDLPGAISGPVSSTDNAIPRWDGTSGDTLQDSGVTISDTDVMSGVTQLNVDNLRLDGNTVSSTDTNGNINLTPDGTGINVLANAQVTGLTASEIVITDASKNLVSAAVATYPSLTELTYVKGVTSAIQTQIDAKMTNPMTTGGDIIYGGASGAPTRLANGSAGQVLTSGGTTVAPTWETPASGGDVSAAANLTDNAIVRGDGGAKGVQTSGVLIDDSDNITGLGTLNTNTLPTGPDTLVGRATTDTLTNKRITPRVQSVVSAATVTPSLDDDDMVIITAQAEGLTLANMSGTGTQGQKMVIRIKDNGTSRSIAYGGNYRAVGVTLPTATTANKTIYLGIVYNLTDSKFDVVVAEEEDEAQSANTSLSNLASVAINTDLISDTDSTDSIGSTSIRWLKGWFDDIETTNAPTIGGVAATGTGGLVRATSPTLVTPALGTPASGVMTNVTGLPTTGLVDDAVTLAKMAAGTAGNLITYDASGNPAAVATGTSGQVLTSNGAGAAPTFQAASGGFDVQFSAYMSANQTFTTTDAIVDFDTENFDVGADFDATTQTFTAPTTGYYFFSVVVNCAASDANSFRLFIKKNAAYIAETIYKPDGTSGRGATVWSGLVAMTATDTLAVWGDSDGSRDVLGGADQSTFSGFQVA